MKFLINTNHSYMLWRFRKELIEELSKSGEVVISTPFVGHEEDFERLGCRCVQTHMERRGINPFADLGLLFNYYKLLKQEKPDMVITYSIKPNIYTSLVCRFLKIEHCVNIQGLGTAFQRKGIATLVTLMYRLAVKRAKAVFFENSSNLNEFVKRKIITEKQAVLLPGAGVNTKEYPQMPYHQDSNEIRFLYLGRIMKEKGIDELFEAARELKKKYPDRFHLDLVGFFEEEYKLKVEALEKEGIAKFHGFHDEPIKFYAAAHCVVLPSYHEGMSNVLLEAAATGRALITSNIPGCREAVDDGVTGFLCEKKNASDVMACMERFINLTAKERENMGKAGHEKIVLEFEKGIVVEKALAAIMK